MICLLEVGKEENKPCIVTKDTLDKPKEYHKKKIPPSKNDKIEKEWRISYFMTETVLKFWNSKIIRVTRGQGITDGL